MSAASARPGGQWEDRSARRRAASIAVTILFHLLLLTLFLRLAPPLSPPGPDGARLTAFDLPPSPELRAARERVQARQRTRGGAPPRRSEEAPPPPPPKPAPAQPWVINPELAQFDLSRGRKTAPAEQAAAPADQGEGTGAGSGIGSDRDAGEAPGGGRMFYAQWYREPSRAELDTYLPRRGGLVGWGEIACRTIERYHVEDCRELDESPRGSGFARAAREAAWQFLVRPPRIGGKSMVGAWVRIHIEITPPPKEAP